MPTALALRHVAFEDLGLLAPWLMARGWRIAYRDLGIDALDDAAMDAADLLVVLGGPIGAEDDARYPFLADERRLIARRLAQRRPLLGICLGAQLMASALGARVRPMGAVEIGVFPLSVTNAAVGTPLASLAGRDVLHWHGDRFELPAGIASLAVSERCDHQAFMVGTTAMAWQFHLEADPSRFAAWLVGHAGELARAGIDPVALQRDVDATADGMARDLDAVMRAWFDVLGFQSR
ncbi:MAG: glutamine amidotransferase [Silanimonas sp.]